MSGSAGPAARHELDVDLAELLEVEQELEARVRTAEEESRRDIDAARVASSSVAVEMEASVAAKSAEEEKEDVARHRAEIQRVEDEGASRIRQLASLPEEAVHRLASELLA